MEKIKTAQRVFEEVKGFGRKILTEYESKIVIRGFGIPTTRDRLAKSPEEAAIFAKEIGLPVVLKICSPDISHKTEAGCVRLQLTSLGAVRTAYEEIIQAAKRYKPKARILGVSIQNMVPPGYEVIIGLKKDPQFGPVLMFGLGGIFVELLKDVSFRLAPITKKEGMEMIREVKGFPLLEGYRGQKPADLEAITEIMEKTSEMAMELPEIKELDMNPLFVYERKAIAVDARILLT